MKRYFKNRQSFLHCMSLVTLLIGLGCSGLVYLRADVAPENPLLNEFEYSKKYQHDMELYGGKANVIANEITNWFSGLWHGKGLACTIACFTMFTAACLFFVARHTADQQESAVEEETRKQN